MIILLEGADCSGKTTLGEEIKKAFCAEYVHHTQDTNSISEFSSTLNKAAARREAGGVTVIDRLWISEMIYGPVMRNLTHDPDGLVMRLCHMAGVVTVMCVRQDITKHLTHFRDVSETRDEYAKDNISTIIHAYYDLWYGKHDAKYSGLLGKLVRQTPLKLLRSYYQYDMDVLTPQEFTNWLLRIR